MADRRALLRASGLVLAGFIAGGVCVGGLLGWRFGAWHRDQYYDRLLSIANTAHMVRANRQKELLETIDFNIRQCIVSADSLWGDVDERLFTLWFIEKYYKENNLPIPEDVRPILDRLPPPPPKTCGRRQAESSATQRAEPAASPATQETLGVR